jgi:predicted glutamine amidotransferase
MCRIAAYVGPAIPLENIIVRPKHSLLQQSQPATEAKLAVNGTGSASLGMTAIARRGCTAMSCRHGRTAT